MKPGWDDPITWGVYVYLPAMIFVPLSAVIVLVMFLWERRGR